MANGVEIDNPALATTNWFVKMLIAQTNDGMYSEASGVDFVDVMFDALDKQIEKRANATTTEAKERADKNITDILTFIGNQKTALSEKMKGLDVEYTPNAKAGSQEEIWNKSLEFYDKLNLMSYIAEAKASGADVDYGVVFNEVLNSDRFAEAAKQIEKLKKTEKGAERTTEQFNKALLGIIKSTDYKGSNLEKFIEYLKDDLGLEFKTDTEEDLMSLSKAIVTSTAEAKEATKTDLLFADSFSKIIAARKAFEEGLQNVESGTEDFESYAASYEEAMKLLKKGYDLDNGVLMAHVERLISDEQLEKLGYEADGVKRYLQDHLKGVFGDKDTNQPGKGLVDKIKNGVDENGEIYGKDEKGNKKVIASFKDNRWEFSDNEDDIKQLGEKFGMTTDQILACVKALNTYNDIDLNNTDTIIGKLKEENKVLTV